MDDASRTRTSRTTNLTPVSVISAALMLAETEGLRAVSIRRLAKRLGVTPMAIYWHVRNKDELLDGMAAGILEQVDLSRDETASWSVQLRALLGSMLQVIRAHPGSAELISTRTTSTKGSLQATEIALDILRRGGFSSSQATQIVRHAVTTLANLVVGQPGVVVGDESDRSLDERRRAQEFLSSLPTDQFPRLVEAAGPLSEGIDPEDYFDFGLELLVSGIEAMATRSS